MLPSLCAFFLAGLVVGSFLPYFPIFLFSVLLVFTLLLSVLEWTGVIDRHRSLSSCAAVCLGIAYWTWAAPPPVGYVREGEAVESSQEYTARIVGLVQHAPSRMTMLIELEPQVNGSSVPRMIRLTWRDPDGVVFSGDRIGFRGKLRRPAGSLNPGGFDYAAYVERQGIDAVGTVSGPEAVRRLASTGDGNCWWKGWGYIDRWRSIIRTAALNSLTQPALGVFLGIVIGERGFVQEDLQEWFMTTGTIHLLSISGSHLGLIAVVAFAALRRGLTALPAVLLLNLSRRMTPTRWAILGTWLVVSFYALLAGAELATMRAWIMIDLAFAAMWIGSKRQLLHALSGAALLILLHDPRAIGDISFQLSFLSVLAIVWMAVRQVEPEDPVSTTWGVWSRHIREAVVLGAAVMVTTTPLVAWYFNQVPWLGLVTNLVAVPFTGIILVPVGLLSACATLLNSVDSLPFSSIQQHLVEWMVDSLHWCAALPGGDWRVPAPKLWMMAAFYLGLPLIVGTASSRCRRIVGAGLIAMALGGWIVSGSPRSDGDQWRVTFLDVGQGDSAVLQLPDGKTVLIDGGKRFERFDMGRGVIGPFLLNQGIRRLDHVIATHPQQDHVGGLPWVVRHWEVGDFWRTGIERPEPLFEELRLAVATKKIHDHVTRRGEEIVSGDVCRVSVLNPVGDRHGEGSVAHPSGAFLNDESVVTQLFCGHQTILFAADIETDGLRRLAGFGQDPVTVLKVPHHGARSSLNRDWIERVRPRFAVISAGRHNAYGHPVREVMEAYSAVGSEIARTDLDGAIIVTGRLSTSDLQVRKMRDLVLQSVMPGACFWTCERSNWHRVWIQFDEF